MRALAILVGFVWLAAAVETGLSRIAVAIAGIGR